MVGMRQRRVLFQAYLLTIHLWLTAATAEPFKFEVLDHRVSSEVLNDRYLRDGVVLLKFPVTDTFLQDVFDVLDPVLNQAGFTRRVINEEDNVSHNPTNSSAGVSPLRIKFKAHATLAPADNTVQGPHQEGASRNRGNQRILVFMCEEPAEIDGGTALFDMQKAWQLLPRDLKARLSHSAFIFPQHTNGVSVLPAVVRNDVTGAPCLQYYCFGRASRDCVDVYRHTTKKYHVTPDPYQYGMHPEKPARLISHDGTEEPFIGLDLYRMLTTIYGTMVPHSWSRGEVLVVDNVRWAHARLDGSGPKRKVHFFTYGPPSEDFDLWKLARPSAEN